MKQVALYPRKQPFDLGLGNKYSFSDPYGSEVAASSSGVSRIPSDTYDGCELGPEIDGLPGVFHAIVWIGPILELGVAELANAAA